MMKIDLFQRCLDGDDEAFSLLVEEYKAYVFAIILKFVQEQDIVQDIAQEVFLQVYRSLPGYRSQNFKGWIGKITVNKAIDYKRAQERRIWELADADMAVRINKEENLDPDGQLMQKEKKLRVIETLNQLPAIYKLVMYKFYFQGKSYEEIACEEGISLKTVESRLYRGRNIFRQKWGVQVDEALH